MNIIRRINKGVVNRYSCNWMRFKLRIHELLNNNMFPFFEGAYALNVEGADVEARVANISRDGFSVTLKTDNTYGAYVSLRPVDGRLGIRTSVRWPEKETKLLRIFACVHLCALAELMTPDRKPATENHRNSKPSAPRSDTVDAVAAMSGEIEQDVIIENSALPVHVVFERDKTYSAKPASGKKRKEPDHAIIDRPFLRHCKSGKVTVVHRTRYKDKGNPRPAQYRLTGKLPTPEET